MPLILVADDDAIVRHVMVQALADAGYEVATASDGGEALAQARERRPNLILLDYRMPVIEGDIVLKRIRSDTMLQQTPVIMLTSADQKSDVLALAQHDLDGYLLKSSFDLTALLTRVEDVLSRRACQTQADAARGTHSQQSGEGPERHQASRDAVRNMMKGEPLLTGAEFRARLRSFHDLPVLTPLVNHVKTLSSKSSTTRDELVEALHLDPGLCARLLHPADADPASAGRTLESAIVRLGISKVGTLAESAEPLHDFMNAEREPDRDMQALWEHAVLCGRFTASIMRSRGDAAGEVRMGRLAGSLRYCDRMLMLHGAEAH